MLWVTGVAGYDISQWHFLYNFVQKVFGLFANFCLLQVSTTGLLSKYWKKKHIYDNSQSTANFSKTYRDHSSIKSAKKWVGGVRKWQFLQIYSTIYADVGEWVGLKCQKHADVILEWSHTIKLQVLTHLN